MKVESRNSKKDKATVCKLSKKEFTPRIQTCIVEPPVEQILMNMQQRKIPTNSAQTIVQ
jgi:hypothetical protein